MPDTKEDKAVLDMEADVRAMAQRVRPNVASAPMPTTRDTVTVGKLRSALVALHEKAFDTEQHVRRLAWQLAGGEPPDTNVLGATTPVRDSLGSDYPVPVFEALAAQVVQVARALTRIEEDLKHIDGALS